MSECPKQDVPMAAASSSRPPIALRTRLTISSGSPPSYSSFRSSSTGSARSSKPCARTEDEPTSSASTVATRRIYPWGAVAVVIASNLRKELAGSVLFDGVSFKVERRDRLALAGPNGAGKTTLLRLLAGETDLHGGELAFQKSARIALHDQRPPLKLGLTLRDYVLAGATDLIETEQELRRLEESMAVGDHGPATLRR